VKSYAREYRHLALPIISLSWLLISGIYFIVEKENLKENKTNVYVSSGISDIRVLSLVNILPFFEPSISTTNDREHADLIMEYDCCDSQNNYSLIEERIIAFLSIDKDFLKRNKQYRDSVLTSWAAINKIIMKEWTHRCFGEKIREIVGNNIPVIILPDFVKWGDVMDYFARTQGNMVVLLEGEIPEIKGIKNFIRMYNLPEWKLCFKVSGGKADYFISWFELFKKTSYYREIYYKVALARSELKNINYDVVKVAKKWRVIMEGIAGEENVDWRLIAAIIHVESRFDAGAVSPMGAMGLMQILPDVAEKFGCTDPFDVFQNIRAGTRYFKYLHSIWRRRYNDTIALYFTLASYNGGIKNMMDVSECMSKTHGDVSWENIKQCIYEITFESGEDTTTQSVKWDKIQTINFVEGVMEVYRALVREIPVTGSCAEASL